MNTYSPPRILLGLTLDELTEVAAFYGLRPFAARQMARWLYEKRVTSIAEMTDLPAAVRRRMEEELQVGRYAPKAEALSVDGTAKYLWEGAGGCDIESVFIPDRDRATLCVSSQAGCKMGCTFCMTGRQGFHGQLTVAQILNQIFSVPGSERLTNLVFMGMGEPADNADNVIKAIEILTAKWGAARSPGRITVSSIGAIPGLKKILDLTKVHIAISLHSPLASQRLELMPVEKAFPIADVLSLLRGYDFARQRRLSFEYIMFDGLNSSMRSAAALGRMLKGLHCRVNLIRFHAIPGSPLKGCSQEVMEQFRDRLNEMGITATIRASRGEDIMAACGMLAGRRRNPAPES